MKNHSIRSRLFGLILVTMVPLLIVVIYLIISFYNYSIAYGSIVDNMTIANSYNLNFKEEMDESLYRLAVGYSSFDTIDEDEQIKDPYKLLEELRSEFGMLATITTDPQSGSWLVSLLRNIDTLEDRMDDLRKNIEEDGQYADSMDMLENNIYILTDLIQDDIQYYIYYQTKSIENLKYELNGRISTFIFVVILLTGVIVLIAVFISGIVVRSITRPVKELVKATEKIARGEFESHVDVHSNDEIATLSESVNDMARHLQVMVEQIKEDERKMRYAELRLLQEQINPHFLYNTLDTIVWLIETNNPEGAVKMLVSLSEFFRLVLNKGKEAITIRDEEQHIRSYLEIQPFIVTMAGMFFCRGMTAVICTDQLSITLNETFVKIANLKIELPFGAYTNRKGVLQIPFIRVPVVIALVVLVVIFIMLKFTKFGRSLYAVGGNETSAKMMGLNVKATKVKAYILSSFLCSIGGICFCMNTMSGSVRQALGLEMDAISSAVIGGTLLTGGVGNVIGSFFGVLINGTISTLVKTNGKLLSSWSNIAVAALLCFFIMLQAIFAKIKASNKE